VSGWWWVGFSGFNFCFSDAFFDKVINLYEDEHTGGDTGEGLDDGWEDMFDALVSE